MSGQQRRMLALCLATVYLVWGTSYMATRVGVLNLPPLLFAGLRFAISGVLLLAVATWRGGRAGRPVWAPLLAHWRHVLAMALLGVALCNGLHTWGMQWVPSNTSALLNASSALWIVIFGLFGERSHRPPPRAIAGLIVGFIGTALLMWPSHDAGATPLVPMLAILLACMIWSLGTIYMRNAGRELDLVAFGGAQMLVGGILLLLGGVIGGELGDWKWSPAGLWSMAYLIVFSSCFAYLAYWWLARHATPAQTGTYSYVNPALAAVVGYLVLDEHLGQVQILGAAVILVGVLLINWPTSETIVEEKPPT